MMMIDDEDVEDEDDSTTSVKGHVEECSCSSGLERALGRWRRTGLNVMLRELYEVEEGEWISWKVGMGGI